MTMQTLLALYGDDARMTEEQAAEYLQVAQSTMRNWRHKRTGPPYRKVRGSIRYVLGELRQYDTQAA